IVLSGPSTRRAPLSLQPRRRMMGAGAALAMPTDTTRWRRIRGLIEAAVELEGSERSRFLEESCRGDAALRAEVEALLSHDATGGFPEAAWTRAPVEGRRIGAFVLVREIGSGGMGKVYLAEREDGGFRQRVAI